MENYIIEGEFLKDLVEFKFDELQDAFEDDEFITNMELEFDQTYMGKNVHLIQISDKTYSLTTITCHEKGYSFHWGSSTPSALKAKIESIMDDTYDNED
ncbi:hypothetical protein CN330_12145 [Priestia megaterium]|uniref:hypothetical protein n=1 Tax=Priestia megaterium TaxID=1404 RepID=UPI000BF536FA|nr:hypothetical protein [Priestia megaterium]PEZ12874.1 hypothetical protein CN330_12145 [Priestia megaterium]